ncbi:MAG: TIGR00269 family protein [Methanomassiliicoccales archaeon]
MVKCSKCDIDAVTYMRYNGRHLCQDHFREYVEKRVKTEIRRQIDLNGKTHITVALSGGKDSSVTLAILADILNPRPYVKLSAITVDEGIKKYRPLTLEKAEILTKSLGVQHHIISFEDELQITMDAISKRVGKKTPCTYCGVLRRRCMNKVAREIGANAIATGLNLDDTAQSIMMNFTRADVERLARLGPHKKVQPGLIPRIQPLRRIPEKEVYLYAMLRRIPFSDEICPYADEALRNEYRELIDTMESRSPGTKHSILASYDAILPMLRNLYPPASLNLCPCGEPTPKERCMACELLDEIRTKRVQKNSRYSYASSPSPRQ